MWCLPSVDKRIHSIQTETKAYFIVAYVTRDKFAYNRLDDEDFIEALAESYENHPLLVSFKTHENKELIFSSFDFNDIFDNPLHDVDSDIQFYNNHYSGSLHACDYYRKNLKIMLKHWTSLLL